MADEVEALGGVATATLAARELDRARPAPRAPAHAAHAECQNCGGALLGAFCHRCGQSAHVHRTLGHVLHEFAHGILHVDGKLWRTLPLLALNPGRLTRDYTHGRRARYIAPLGLYLFVVLLTFLVLGFTGGPTIGPMPQQALTDTRADLANAQRRLAQLDADPDATTAQRTAARTKLADVREELAVVERMANGETSWLDRIGAAARAGEMKVDSGNADIDRRIRKALSNPELTFYKVQQKAYKLSFLLIPMSVPALWLLFVWRRGITTYDHAVFVLYSLSFMLVLAMVAAVVLAAAPGPAAIAGLSLAATVVPPIHMFAQLKGAYRLSMWSALWRTAVLVNVAIVILSLFAAGIILLGFVD